MKITLETIESKIINEVYHVFHGTTVTVCLLTLENGYHAIGQSACVDPKEFDVALGRKYAREDAINKIWALEGYLAMQNSWVSKIVRGSDET